MMLRKSPILVHTKARSSERYCDYLLYLSGMIKFSDPVRKTGIISIISKSISVASVFSIVYKVADSTLTLPVLRFEE
jgi:hypothetical protein